MGNPFRNSQFPADDAHEFGVLLATLPLPLGRGAAAAAGGEPVIRVGKLGIVRCTGKDLEALRDACWERDEGICQRCGAAVYKQARFDGDPLAYDMAHRRNKLMYGDVLGNIDVNCHECHMNSHNCGGKPLPPKPR